MAKKAKIIILEGTWWKSHEVPLVLPYFQALAASHGEIDLSHRTFRNKGDIAHYVSKINKDAGALLYFACHGSAQHLAPAGMGKKDKISPVELCEALGEAKEGALSFIHFGCCEMVAAGARAESHSKIMEASGAEWASGYTKDVDWLPSTFLDLSMISEIFIPAYQHQDGRKKRVKARGVDFINNYSQLAKGLGFSAQYKTSAGDSVLFPKRQHK